MQIQLRFFLEYKDFFLRNTITKFYSNTNTIFLHIQIEYVMQIYTQFVAIIQATLYANKNTELYAIIHTNSHTGIVHNTPAKL